MSPFVFWPVGILGRASGLAAVGGFIAGILTAFLAVHCGILHLLAGILIMIAGFSINIRIMGRPNLSLLGEDTIFSVANVGGFSEIIFKPLLLAVLVFLLAVFLTRFLLSETGLAMRATGINVRMVRAQGGNPDFYFYFGLGLSNALVALGGRFFLKAPVSPMSPPVSAPLFLVWPPSFWVKHYCAEAPLGGFTGLFAGLYFIPSGYRLCAQRGDIWLASVRFKFSNGGIGGISAYRSQLRQDWPDDD